MRLRERLQAIMRRFETALTRVEDRGVRIESNVESIKNLMAQLNDSVDRLASDIAGRHRDLEREVVTLKNQMIAVNKSLGIEKPKH